MIIKTIENNFDTVWERIRDKTDIKSLRQLAVIIGKKQPTISAAKAKGEFPAGWAYLVGNKFGLLTEWIMTGKGPVTAEEQIKGSRKYEILNEVEDWLDEQVRRNPKRKEWFELQLLDSFQTFKEWRRKKDQEESSESGSSTRKVA